MHLPDDTIDLHVHSTASDGTRSPAELVALACRDGVSILSITDHDTVDGIREAHGYAQDVGLDLIPGVELSVDLGYDDLSAHLLGYFPGVAIDVLSDPSTSLGKAIAFVQNGRENRNPRILKKLADMGIDLDMENIRRIAGGDVIGRPHIAEALVEGGFIKEIKEAFTLYLASGKPAYVDRDRLNVNDAIAIILEAGGLPVLAHPGFIPIDQYALIALVERLAAEGLAGVETYYPGHDRAVIELLRGTADRLGIVVTGGTDYHGWKPDHIGLGRAQGGFHLTRSMVGDFLALCGERIGTEELLHGQTQ